ncbi:MAG: acetylxylan esterase [Clostridia bacterium]|nr:acetylxylan esterase [Clostridia bacterium]
MQILHSKFTEFNALKNTVPSMVFDPEKETLEVWQEKAGKKLEELLGLPHKKCNALFEKEHEKELENCTEIRFTYQSEEGEFVPAVMWIPKNCSKEKPPVMICLQGHSTGMHISMGRVKFDGDEESVSSGDRDFAVQCIKHGIAAISVEQRCFGERGGNPDPDCYTASMAAILSGRTIIGGRVWDVMSLIDVLESEFSEILDTDKIYCMGNSGGGTATFYATALEKRIKASIPSCAFATFYGSIGTLRHCACNYVPSISKYFDMAEIAGLIAPRPIVIVSGKEDKIFPLETAEHEFERLKSIYYKNCEKPDNCVHVKGEGGHRFYAKDSWQEFNRLLKENNV